MTAWQLWLTREPAQTLTQILLSTPHIHASCLILPSFLGTLARLLQKLRRGRYQCGAACQAECGIGRYVARGMAHGQALHSLQKPICHLVILWPFSKPSVRIKLWRPNKLVFKCAPLSVALCFDYGKRWCHSSVAVQNACKQGRKPACR